MGRSIAAVPTTGLFPKLRWAQCAFQWKIKTTYWVLFHLFFLLEKNPELMYFMTKMSDFSYVCVCVRLSISSTGKYFLLFLNFRLNTVEKQLCKLYRKKIQNACLIMQSQLGKYNHSKKITQSRFWKCLSFVISSLCNSKCAFVQGSSRKLYEREKYLFLRLRRKGS